MSKLSTRLRTIPRPMAAVSSGSSLPSTCETSKRQRRRKRRSRKNWPPSTGGKTDYPAFLRRLKRLVES
jgi:hypothetical protein